MKGILYLIGLCIIPLGAVLFLTAIGGYSEGTQTFTEMMSWLLIATGITIGGAKLTTLY